MISRFQCTFAVSFVMLTLSILPSRQTVRGQNLEIATRPFMIFNDRLLQNHDGWFDARIGIQKIGLLIRNSGGEAAEDVVGNISFPIVSGILGTEVTYNFGTIAPGQTVLGIFEADFTGVFPAKYNFTVELVGSGGFSQIADRAAFIAASQINALTDFQVEIPQGTIRTEYFSFFGGTNTGSIMAPTAMKMTVTPPVPFAGQFSELPFEDPWWKAFGAGMVIGSGINMIIDGVAEACGGDYLDSAGEKINVGLGVSGGGAAAADFKDPFRRGQENTFPPKGSLTIREEVEMVILYDTPPTPKEPFTGQVNWIYTRFLDNVTTQQFVVNEPFENIHFSQSRTTNINQPIFFSGDELVITSTIADASGPLNGARAFVTASISTIIDAQQKQLIGTFISFDDGTHGDAIAGDGIFTTIVPIDESFASGEYAVDVFQQDLNEAPEVGDPLILAQEIGGQIIGHPDGAPACGITFDESFVVKQGILLGDVNCDGAVDLLDVAPFIELLSKGGYSEKADMNQDGLLNLLDVAPFVAVLAGG